MTEKYRRRFADIDALKATATANGSHFFDRDTMRFFGSRILPTLYGPVGDIFVTSEKQPDFYGHSAGTLYTFPRLYTVRRYIGTGREVETLGDFQGHETRRAAERAARRYAEEFYPA